MHDVIDILDELFGVLAQTVPLVLGQVEALEKKGTDDVNKDQDPQRKEKGQYVLRSLGHYHFRLSRTNLVTITKKALKLRK